MKSYRLHIDPRKAVAARLIEGVRRGLQDALLEEKAQTRLTQQDIATRLGVHRSVVNRHFLGSENLTLRTIAELAWALDHEVHFQFLKPPAARSGNRPTSVTVELLDDGSEEAGMGVETSTSDSTIHIVSSS